MDIIGFLCVSLVSITIQLHENLGSRRAYSEACFSSQNGDRAWGCTTEEQHSVALFFRAKGLNANDIHQEMFPVYGGKCLSHKRIQHWVEKFSQGRLKVADDDRPGAEVAETTDKRLLCCGFWRTAKAMGQVYKCSLSTITRVECRYTLRQPL
jgi:hypothetical protein